MDADSKDPSLKELQGHIWEEGYRSGALRGEVFADVAPALDRWQREGVSVGVFSSGSVLAQRLLFRHSTAGDLTRFITWHFDTAVGAKIEAASYARIANSMAVPPPSITFVSDVVRELDAAAAAGLRTALSVRPGNPAQPAGHRHPAVQTFDGLLPGIPGTIR